MNMTCCVTTASVAVRVCVCVCAAERDYDVQFWKEELVREINELEKSAVELEVKIHYLLTLRQLVHGHDVTV